METSLIAECYFSDFDMEVPNLIKLPNNIWLLCLCWLLRNTITELYKVSYFDILKKINI